MSGVRNRESAVLVDANVIIEAHRTRSWRALSRGWRVDTVEDCVTETQTGFQLRRREETIDLAELRSSLATVHSVSVRERVGAAQGEHRFGRTRDALWAHAVGRDDAWLLCGPDRASLRCGIRLGHRERLVSLEELLTQVGHRPSIGLRPAYTRSWHHRVVGQIQIEELPLGE